MQSTSRLSRCCWLAAIGLLVSEPRQAHSQPLCARAESIESTVFNASVVAVGRIVSFDAGGESRDPDERNVTFEVEEMLKGRHREQLRVRARWPASTLRRWSCDDQSRLLVATRGDPLVSTAAIDLDDPELAVLTGDFNLLRNPDEVLRNARDAVRKMPGVTRIQTFDLVVPRELVRETKWSEYYRTSGHLTLTVPVDATLERWAIEHVDSRHLMECEAAARALRYFKSDENIARVKLLLDNSQWACFRQASENQGIEVRHYSVRQAAWQTLTFWGIDVERPTIRERVRKLEAVTFISLVDEDVTEEVLRKLTRFENLETLSLQGSRVLDACLNGLRDLKTLRSLNLAGTKVTDAALKHLAAVENLEFLDLIGTAVTGEGAARLRALHPDLKIER